MAGPSFRAVDFDPFATEAAAPSPGPIPAAARTRPVDFDPFAPPRREPGIGELALRGVKSAGQGLSKDIAFMLGLPGAALVDAFVGGNETVDSVGAYIDDRARDEQSVAINPQTEDVGTVGQVAFGAPRVIGDLGMAFATGGESLAARPLVNAGVRQGLARAVESGAKASVLPGAALAAERAKAVTDAGGSPEEALGAALTAYAATSATNALPASASGSAIVRALQGAPSGVAADYAQRQIENLAVDDRLELDSGPMTGSDAVLSAIFGSGLAGIAGERGAGPLPSLPPAALAELAGALNPAPAAAAPAPSSVTPEPAVGNGTKPRVRANPDGTFTVVEPGPLQPFLEAAAREPFRVIEDPAELAADAARRGQPAPAAPVPAPVVAPPAVGERLRAPAPPPEAPGPALGEVEAARAADVPPPAPPAKRPPTLLHHVANVGLNRAAFEAAGISPDYFTQRAGFNYVFRKNGGMTPDQLRERMEEDGFLQPNEPGAPPRNYDADAVNLLQEALDGREVYSFADQARAAELSEADRADAERAIAEVEGVVGQLDDVERQRAVAMAGWMAEADARGIDPEPRPDEDDDAYILRLADEIEAQEASRDAGAAQEVVGRGEGPPSAPAGQAAGVAAAAARPVGPAPAADAARQEVTEPAAPSPAGLNLGGDSRPATERDPSPRETTSLRNEVRDQERAARGEEPVAPTERQSTDETLRQGREAIAADREAPRKAIERASAGEPLSLTDHAVLLAHKRDLMVRWNQAAAEATDPDATPEARAEAKQRWDALELEANEADVGTTTAGTAAGRALQLRQMDVREDWSLERMLTRARVARGGELPAEERAIIQKQAEAIADLNRRLDEAQTQTDSKVIESLVRDMVAQMRAPAPKGARLVDRMRQQADEARAAIAAMDDVSSLPGPRGQKGAVMNPVVFVHLTKIGAYHVVNGVTKFTDFVARMKADLGAKFSQVEPAMQDVWAAAKAAAAAARSSGIKVDTPADVSGGIDPNNLTHADVYKLARAHVLNGVTGADAVMKATHADLAGLPGLQGLTERDVRRLFSDYGKAVFPSKEADKVELRKIRAMVRLQESIDRMREGLAPLRTGPQRDRMAQEVRALQRQLNDLLKQAEREAGPDPLKLATYQDARRTALRNQIADLERMIRTGERRAKVPAPPLAPDVKALQAERDQLRRELKAIDKGAGPTPEERYERGRNKALTKRANEIRDRLARGDYERSPPRVPKPVSDRNRKLQFELDELKRQFAIRQYAAEMEKRTPLRKVFDTGRAGLNLARAIMTSLDLSAVLRQGGFIALGNPVRAAKRIPDLLTSFVSAERAHAINSDLKKRDNAPLYKKHKLFIADTDGQGVNAAEEAFIGRLLNKMDTSTGSAAKRAAKTAANLALAPIRGSGRAYVTFLNVLRADTFDALAATLGRSKVLTDDEGNAIANFVNVATGRGKLGFSKQSSQSNNPLLNEIFFAPRLVASRFNLLAGQPLYGGSNRTRKLIALEYARFLMGVAVVYGLGYLARQEDDDKKNKDKPFLNLDWRSTDFGKMRFGNTYVDPLAGLAQVTAFTGKMVTGEKLSGKGDVRPLREDLSDNLDLTNDKTKGPGYGQDDMLTVLGRFLRTKLAPVPGAVISASTGKDPSGQATTPGEQAVNLVTPMSLRNVVDVMEENGVPRGTAIWMAELFGMSVQYRDPNAYEKDKQP